MQIPSLTQGVSLVTSFIILLCFAISLTVIEAEETTTRKELNSSTEGYDKILIGNTTQNSSGNAEIPQTDSTSTDSTFLNPMKAKNGTSSSELPQTDWTSTDSTFLNPIKAKNGTSSSDRRSQTGVPKDINVTKSDVETNGTDLPINSDGLNITESPINQTETNTTVFPIYQTQTPKRVPHTHSSTARAAHRTQHNEGNGTVVYSWTIFCHGSTSPIDPYPNDRYSPAYWEFQLDWLTSTGQEEMCELGKWIRERYSKLCDRYHPGTVEVLSEPSDCTFMSAECLLTGLFPANSSLFHKNTGTLDMSRPWQPIPVHTVQSTMDLLGEAKGLVCRQYDIELDDVTDNPPYSTLPETYNSMINQIATHCGYSFTDLSLEQMLQTIFEVYYDLKAEELAGLPMKAWMKNVYPEPLETLSAKYLELFTFTDTLKRFKAGPTIGKIVQSMEKKIKGNLEENLKLYSGSLYSLTSIMNAFGVFNHIVPPFASAFVIELSKSQGQFFVSMCYKNSSSSSPYTLSIPDCGNKCPFDKFSTLMKDKIPTNWNEECDVIPIAALTLSTPLLLAGLVVIIVLIFLALLLLIKCCRCFNKKKSTISNY